jgi:hypothetical protein
MEGSLCYNPATGCNQSGKVLPIAEYDHTLGCSVTGGYVYRGLQFPQMNGYYFYGDFCSGLLYALQSSPQSGRTPLLISDTAYSISSFGEDEQGELYMADYASGKVYQLAYIRTPAKAILNSPSGSITNRQPTFSWSAVTDSDQGDAATWYYLWVNGPSGTVIQKWYQASDVCNGSICSVTAPITLSGGAHSWWIQTWNEAGYGPWSTQMDFSLPFPGKATLVSPTGSNASNLPTYQWKVVSDVTWYYLWVQGSSGVILQQWYTADQANCTGSNCSVTPDTVLSPGSYSWWIQTWNEAGYGPWSTQMDFTIPSPPLPGKAILTSPNGSIRTSTPIYTWNEVSDATWYFLWVNGPSGVVIQQWYTSAQANCNGTTCSVTPATVLSAGTHTWWIQTWNEGGFGPWSDAISFTLASPGQATLVSPSATTATNTPSYIWNEFPGSTWYYLWVNGPSGTVIQQWYTAAQANCNGVTCSVAPTTVLSGGPHTWWIQTWNDAGYGPWSTGMDFVVP